MYEKLFKKEGAGNSPVHKHRKKPQGRRKVALGLGVALAAVLLAVPPVAMALNGTFPNLLGAGDPSQAKSAGDGTTIVDESTIADWKDLELDKDTKNVGRIWTDKTVSDTSIQLSKDGVDTYTVAKAEGSDFLTALSALSSTSNTSTTTTTPLDIVLVLDVSGSMDESMGSGDSTKRITALKTAANTFIDTIAQNNALITDSAKQHQVSIVKFAGDKSSKEGNDTYRAGFYTSNYSQVMVSLKPCTSATKSDFTDMVNAISPAGATRADFGMELASSQLSSRARADSKKVVIFFTDGTPTSSSEFSSSVAGSAVSSAKGMKDSGTTIYSIGIFSGANPEANPTASGTSNENKFMHAVSSNYPSATYTQSGGQRWTWSFGTRAKDSDFYKAASNSAELSKIFDDISKTITAGSGSPTTTTDGAESTSGYITFTDQLGQYMQVDSFQTIVFAEKTFENPTVTTEGNTTTYTFNGEAGNVLYPNGNLNSIIIQVEKSDDLATGDKITVKIPASLIPLRKFDVNMTDDTMEVTDAYPIRLFYNSSLKDEAKESLANPDSSLSEYIENNKGTEDGTVAFYANKWTANQPGDVIADFEPATNNSFYYFTVNTPIYTNSDCTIRATGSLSDDTTYYYQHTYYREENRKPQKVEEAVSFKGFDMSGNVNSDDEGLYIKAGTKHSDVMAKEKTENKTGTGTHVLSPVWNANKINQHLGNNGKLSVELPGTLAISKTVEVPEGYKLDDYTNESFTFSISIPKAAGKSLNAEVKNADGTVVSDEGFTLTFDNDGKATHSIKHGETLYIYGLSAGDTYEVTETDLPDGFDQTAPEGSASGTITAGAISKADFTNTYSATGTLNGESALAGEKKLSGRAWNDTDAFTFEITGNEVSNKYLPSPTTVTVKDQAGTASDAAVAFNFGNITYDKPGTYSYWIKEPASLNDNLNMGVKASLAAYEIVVTVTDSKDGTLAVSSTMKRINNDAGTSVSEEATKATFTNTFDATTGRWAPEGNKNYTDNSGDKILTNGMFSFRLKAEGDAPLPEGAQGGYVIADVHADGKIPFAGIDFTASMVGNTYEYTITEVVKNDSGDWVDVKDLVESPATTYVKDGMTYDPGVWTVTVVVSAEQSESGVAVKVTPTYTKQGDAQSSDTFSFSNEYTPEKVTLEGDEFIHGTKTLTGRDMLDNETFGFALALKKSTAKAGSEAVSGFDTEASVSDGKNGEPEAFDFGSATFTQPGTYTFEVTENKWNNNELPDSDTSGVTFDRHSCTVTIVIKDNNGKLEAESVTYSDGTAGAAFANKYQSSLDYGAAGGVKVSKTLNGRNMKAGEFSFTITGQAGTGTTADEANAKLAEADKSFANANDRAAGSSDIMSKLQGVTFNQDDAGKTFVYEVREIVPADADKLPSVTYDEAVYTASIAVVDNGDGTMTATTTITKAGEEGTYASYTVTTGDTGKVSDADAMAFTNTYRAEEVELDTEAKATLYKILEGRDWLGSDSFTFDVTKVSFNGQETEDAKAAMPDPETPVTVTNAGGKASDRVAFGFGTLTFTQAGTYVYQATEQDGSIPGVTYSTNTAKITIIVIDNTTTGKLEATAIVDSSDFTNTYESKLDYAAAGGLRISKVLTGHAMDEGQFSYTVTPSDEASAAKLGLDEGANTFSTPAAADGVPAFVSITAAEGVEFTQADVDKTYTYTVKEVNDSKPGYTYDATEYTVTITTTDDPTTAKLTVTTTVTAGGSVVDTYRYVTDGTGQDTATVSFGNSYAAEGTLIGSESLTGQKVFNGRAWNETDSFTFKITAAEGTPLPEQTQVTVGKRDVVEGKAPFSFGDITYNKPGTYSYTIEEVVPSQDGIPGVTYSKAVYQVAVTAADNNDGTLNVTSEMTPTKNDSGEVVEGGAAVDTATFTNVFSADAASWAPAGVKNYTDNSGAKPLAANMFNFRLTALDGAPLPEGTTGTSIEASNHDAAGNVSFASIPFTAAMVGNTYTYTIEEIIPAGATADNDYTLNGMTYDPAKWTVTVVVGSETVSGKEVVKLTFSYSKDGEPVEGVAGFAFANSYTPEEVTLEGDAFVHGTKTLTGRDMSDNETFGFTLAAYDDATKAAVTDGTVSGFKLDASVSDGTKGEPVSFNFGDATFTKPGTYTFSVVESAWKGAALPDDGTSGMTFDRNTWTVTIVIIDDNGQLKAGSVTYAAGDVQGAAAAFVNRYATGNTTYDTAQVPLKKVIDGREWLDSDSFTFKIEAETAGAPLPKNAEDEEVTQIEVTKANKDAFSFGTITYTFDNVKDEVGNTKTFTYKVTEQQGTLAGMKYDVNKVVYLDIVVTDNGDGTLSAVGTVRDGDDTFTNTYESGLDYVAAGGLRLSKTLTGHAMAADQFTFTVTPADQASANKLGLSFGANEFKSPAAADGETAFIDVLAGKDVQFTQADAGKTYTYTIAEVNDGAAGYTYDTDTRTVTITTSDDPATAKLTVTTKVVGGPDGDKTFTYKTGEETVEENKAVVPFANSYFATTGEAGADVTATKKLTGRPLSEGEFFFGVKYANAAAGEEDVASATNAADGTVSFGKFNYDTDTLKELVAAQKAVKGTDEQGNTKWTIQYVAYEKTDGLADGGITPTKAQFTFVATVVDNNNGTLTAAATTDDAQGFTFVNTYNTDSANIVLSGTKVLLAEGYSPQSIEGKFTFTISSDDQNAPLPQLTVVKNKADGSVVFDAISFTLDDLNKALGNAGAQRSYTFVYKITEAGTVAGVENDPEATKTVSVKVTDDGKGHLTAALDPAAATAFTFTNTYKPEAATVGIEGTKTLVNRDMNEGETFDFTLAAADEATEKAMKDGSIDQAKLSLSASAQGGTDGQSVDFSFGSASFTKPGTYTFTMQETGWSGKAISALTDKEGLTFDEHTCKVTVKVTDDGAGTLNAEVAYSDGEAAAFTNTYSADMPDNEKAKTNATFTKVLEGREWLDSDSFTFKIEALDGAPLPKDAQDSDVIEITVNKNNAESFSFGQITYTFDMVKNEPNHSKTFQYKVTEVKPAEGAIAGIDYSTNEATLSITVTDNGKGQLIATVTKANDTFTNTYSSGLSYTALGGLKLSKTLSGHAMAEGQFTFKVTPADAESAAKLGFAEGENTFTSSAAEDGATVLIDVLAGKDVQFTQADAGKEYKYTIAEVNDGAAGYTYDTAVRTVTITTSDDPTTAKLTVTTTVVGGPEGTQIFTYMTGDEKPTPAVVPFANKYFASTDEPGGTSAAVDATKELTGRPLEDGEFSFGVKYADAAAGEADVDSAVNDANGKISFTKFGHYTTDTLAELVAAGHAAKGTDPESGKTMWTIHYVAYENTDGLADEGVSPTTASFGFTVTVLDNNDGTLTATAVPDSDSGYVFKNTYSTGDPVPMTLMGRKVLALGQDGLTPNSIEGKFTFTIESQTDGAPLPEDASGQTVTQATNDAKGNVDFGTISFSLDDLNRALGTTEIKGLLDQGAGEEGQSDEYNLMAGKPRSYDFVYTITETGSAPGVTNDAETTRTITFRVTDDGKGHLTVEMLPAGDVAFTFTNTYNVEPKDSSITDQLTVVKSLTGRDMNEGEFSFELLEGNDVVATAVNDADGNVAFSSIKYTKPGVHNYTIREVKAGTTEAGVTYDGTTFAVKTVVSDNGDGTLSVEHAFASDVRMAEFKNVYKPNPTSVALGASKVLTGKTLAEGQFTFKLAGADGTSWEAKNTAGGQVLFPSVTFDKVGTYEYTISEVNDGQANITYDTTEHKVTVTVTDNLKGSLVADIAYENGNSPVFKNTYVPPSPKKNLSKTGDDLGGIIGGAAAAVVVAAAAAGVAYKRSRKRDEQ